MQETDIDIEIMNKNDDYFLKNDENQSGSIWSGLCGIIRNAAGLDKTYEACVSERAAQELQIKSWRIEKGRMFHWCPFSKSLKG